MIILNLILKLADLHLYVPPPQVGANVRGHVPITENWALDGAATRLGGSPFALGGVEFELALEGRAVPWTPKDGAEGACRDLEICLVVRRMPQAAGASEAKPALAIWLHLVAGDRWSGWQVAADNNSARPS